MFYSKDLLSKRSPLGAIWMIAHGKKLNKQKLMGINVLQIIQEIMQPEVPHSLRLQGILVGGVVLVFSRQQTYLLEDIQEMMRRVKEAINATSSGAKATLKHGKDKARKEAITLEDLAEVEEQLNGIDMNNAAMIPLPAMAAAGGGAARGHGTQRPGLLPLTQPGNFDVTQLDEEDLFAAPSMSLGKSGGHRSGPASPLRRLTEADAPAASLGMAGTRSHGPHTTRTTAHTLSTQHEEYGMHDDLFAPVGGAEDLAHDLGFDIVNAVHDGDNAPRSVARGVDHVGGDFDELMMDPEALELLNDMAGSERVGSKTSSKPRSKRRGLKSSGDGSDVGLSHDKDVEGEHDKEVEDDEDHEADATSPRQEDEQHTAARCRATAELAAEYAAADDEVLQMEQEGEEQPGSAPDALATPAEDMAATVAAATGGVAGSRSNKRQKLDLEGTATAARKRALPLKRKTSKVALDTPQDVVVNTKDFRDWTLDTSCVIKRRGGALSKASGIQEEGTWMSQLLNVTSQGGSMENIPDAAAVEQGYVYQDLIKKLLVAMPDASSVLLMDARAVMSALPATLDLSMNLSKISRAAMVAGNHASRPAGARLDDNIEDDEDDEDNPATSRRKRARRTLATAKQPATGGATAATTARDPLTTGGLQRQLLGRSRLGHDGSGTAAAADGDVLYDNDDQFQQLEEDLPVSGHDDVEVERLRAAPSGSDVIGRPGVMRSDGLLGSAAHRMAAALARGRSTTGGGDTSSLQTSHDTTRSHGGSDMLGGMPGLKPFTSDDRAAAGSDDLMLPSSEGLLVSGDSDEAGDVHARRKLKRSHGTRGTGGGGGSSGGPQPQHRWGRARLEDLLPDLLAGLDTDLRADSSSGRRCALPSDLLASSGTDQQLDPDLDLDNNMDDDNNKENQMPHNALDQGGVGLGGGVKSSAKNCMRGGAQSAYKPLSTQNLLLGTDDLNFVETNGDASQMLPSNSGLLSKTSNTVLQLVRGLLTAQAAQGVADPSVSFMSLVSQLTRPEAVKLFMQVLVTHTSCWTKAHQDEPYGDIHIKAGKFMAL